MAFLPQASLFPDMGSGLEYAGMHTLRLGQGMHASIHSRY